MGVTLRYPYEIRKEDDYFGDIPDEKIPNDMLELATHIVDSKTGDFEPAKFADQYEDAVRELLKKKQEGVKIEAPHERKPAKVINLMDALRKSVEAERAGAGAKREPAPPVRNAARRKRRPRRTVGRRGRRSTGKI